MKSKVIATTLLIGAVLVTGCDGDGDEKKPDKKAAKKHKHELVYFEQLSNGDADYPRVEIGYKDKGDKTHTYTAAGDKVYEHILKDKDQSPYVVKDGKKYHVYRTPYMTYDDSEIEGKVKDKGAVGKDD
ncbi:MULTISPECIES: hypothetical protein [Staphylococcus]|uniref:Lipoprotein n=1 Tax=Staphylococcus hsinchuensis TaxID=3051183 RepID=A0ABZ3EF34_9STAP|nr:hypothetical protein [Staphylococcus sp. Marseille-Q6910]